MTLLRATQRISALSRQLSPRAMSTALPFFPASPRPGSSDKFIKTAGILIIGDEVLNGKTRDSNSNFAAKLLFDLAIDLKRIEVIADDEAEIIEAVQRMHKNYDLVITSGGIGPTHDDITYASIAKAFNVELEYDQETIKRMEALSPRRAGFATATEEQKTARLRMALFPSGAHVLFISEKIWVPVVRVGGNIHIFPGVPTLFQQMLENLTSNYLSLPPASEKPFRILVHTEKPESSIAPFLSKLQDAVKKENIRIGSYPQMFQGVDVSLIGKDIPRLQELAEQVVSELEGKVVKQGKLGEETST